VSQKHDLIVRGLGFVDRLCQDLMRQLSDLDLDEADIQSKINLVIGHAKRFTQVAKQVQAYVSKQGQGQQLASKGPTQYEAASDHLNDVGKVSLLLREAIHTLKGTRQYIVDAVKASDNLDPKQIRPALDPIVELLKSIKPLNDALVAYITKNRMSNQRRIQLANRAAALRAAHFAKGFKELHDAMGKLSETMSFHRIDMMKAVFKYMNKVKALKPQLADLAKQAQQAASETDDPQEKHRNTSLAKTANDHAKMIDIDVRFFTRGPTETV